jgi:hypothetical protein
MTGTQVYNYLRKWRQRWMRVSKLRDLSGALWDDHNCMITLEDEHYNGHIKVCVMCCLLFHSDCISVFLSARCILGTP